MKKLLLYLVMMLLTHVPSCMSCCTDRATTAGALCGRMKAREEQQHHGQRCVVGSRLEISLQERIADFAAGSIWEHGDQNPALSCLLSESLSPTATQQDGCRLLRNSDSHEGGANKKESYSLNVQEHHSEGHSNVEASSPYPGLANPTTVQELCQKEV